MKAIAAAFRMTNKAPPSAPSPYVATLLAPLKDFAAASGLASGLALGAEAGGGGWKEAAAEGVASKYSALVLDLLATVRAGLQREGKSGAKRKWKTRIVAIYIYIYIVFSTLFLFFFFSRDALV